MEIKHENDVVIMDLRRYENLILELQKLRGIIKQVYQITKDEEVKKYIDKIDCTLKGYL